jgi:hypothetical protein
MTRHEKHELPEWLIERVETFESLISVLQATKDSMLSLSISPVNDLIRVTIESLELLRRAFQEEWPIKARPNPEVIFDERFSDQLGNVAQQTRSFRVQSAYNPEFEYIVSDLITFFSRFLDNPSFDAKQHFHDVFGARNQRSPSAFISQKSKNAEKRNKKIEDLKAHRARESIIAGGVIKTNDTTKSFQLFVENEL